MTHDLRLERTLDAKPDVVFDLWTDIDADKVLFASDPASTVDVECDLRVGGRWNLTIKPPDGPPILESISSPKSIDLDGSSSARP